MPSKIKYGVNFVGYAAYVIARKNGRDVDYAQLDFISGAAVINATRGWVSSPSCTKLASFVRNLPNRASELRELLAHRAAQVPDEGVAFGREADVATDLISQSVDDSTVFLPADLNVNKFVRQVSGRFTEIEQVLEQAEQVGSRITRRPYLEYIDEISKTGVPRVEGHGFGLFVEGRLNFYPNYQVVFAEPSGPNTFKMRLSE